METGFQASEVSPLRYTSKYLLPHQIWKSQEESYVSIFNHQRLFQQQRCKIDLCIYIKPYTYVYLREATLC